VTYSYCFRLVTLRVHKPYINSCIMQLSCRVRPGYSSPAHVKLLRRQVARRLSNAHSNFPCVLRMRASFQVVHIELIVQLECRITKSYSCTGGPVALFLKLPFTSYYRFDSHFYETVRHTLYSRRVQRWREESWGRESNKGGIKV
jgi:hypothetical protein